MGEKSQGVQPIVKIGHYILGQTLGVGTFGKVKSKYNSTIYFYCLGLLYLERNFTISTYLAEILPSLPY